MSAMAGRIAIVSGGTSGIGRAVALRLAADGAHVVAFSASEARVAALRAELAPDGGHGDAGGSVELHVVDVADAAQVDALVAGVLDRHGRVDALCNSAGIKRTGTLAETDLATWERIFAVNVTGTFLLTKAVLPAMVAQGGGAIVAIGSPSGYGGAGHPAYCASKGAVHTLMAALALDHLTDGVRINTVVAGSTRTGMNADRPEELMRALGRWNVAGRVNDPEDVAAAVAFLLSDAAATISGAQLDVGALAGQHAVSLPSGADEASGS